MNRNHFAVSVATIMLISIVGCSANETPVSQTEVIIPKNGTGDLLSEFIDTFPDFVILDSLTADLNHDGENDLILTYCQTDQNVITSSCDFAIWISGYSCSGFAYGDETSQFIRNSLALQEDGSITLDTYEPKEEKMYAMRIWYSVQDDSNVNIKVSSTEKHTS